MDIQDIADELETEKLVWQRIAALQNEGTWKRIRPLPPPPKHPQCHWDYLLEEMEWMAKVVNWERSQKEKLTKKCSKMIQNHFRKEEQDQKRQAKEEEAQRRRIANQISKLVKQFWSNTGKLVQYKVDAMYDIARRRHLDEKLNEVLTTSEKIAEEISLNLESQLLPADNDQDFEAPSDSESDVEDTIDQEEKQAQLKAKDYEDEVNELNDDNNLTIEELLARLTGTGYPGIGNESPNKRSTSPDITDLSQSTSQGSQNQSQGSSITGQGQKRKRGRGRPPKNRAPELDEEFSQKSSETSSEVIPGPEGAAYSLRKRSKRDDLNLKTDLENNNLDLQNSDDTDDDKSVDGSSLIELLKDESADVAEKIQPSGTTLKSAKVTTKVPHFLRHELREYQHIGLDWLVALYDRKLNGILADEMGLGKTIQTIALLAYLAVEKGNWGPHLIIVPSSLVFNWELEFLRWCPSFKIMTYYGNSKERKLARTGWSVPNSFHICITSYTLVIQDQFCFRRKPWEYMILDEAHNIKNFKSQRWQVLLNFNTQRRLLLTGTPLQNNLMELWSLLHFLNPESFESHAEFKEWFSKPISEIACGTREYNEKIVKRFHNALRPYMLRRLKSEVEKQMPKKIEHVLKCRLSKRQRHLYDEFMARSDTKNSISTGSFLNVLNVLMQLRKVCNHPDLFDPRPVVSSFRMEGVSPVFPKCVWDVTPELDARELLNTRLYGYKTLELDAAGIPDLVYNPDIPQRNIKDPISGKASIINVSVDHEERPYPDVDVRLAPVIKVEKLTYWKWTINGYFFNQIYFPVNNVEVVEGDDNNNMDLIKEDESQEMSQSSFSMSLSQSSYSPFDSQESSSQITVNGGEEDSVDIRVEENPCYVGDEEEEEFPDYLPCSPEEMRLDEVYEKIARDRKLAVANLNLLNHRRYESYCLIDKRLIDCCSTIGKIKIPSSSKASTLVNLNWLIKSLNCYSFSSLGSEDKMEFNKGAGYAAIMMIQKIQRVNPNLFYHPFFSRRIASSLVDLVMTVEQQLALVKMDFVFCIPTVCIQKFPEETIYAPETATIQYRSVINREIFKRMLNKPLSVLHPIASRLATSFPDPRLVEYDCGKLQVLSGLLRELKAGGHKVLLFTQMTKMLNILEAFLNYHGHLYLRMDGSTKVEIRQMLVDQFNKDTKIFIFLLSTRAGGLGINLTGADTVIFYDSDWNPTIDAQAQDRCHRIGQTRDVHIYRLISTNSVEENILKTSNQKRKLGEHAIEEGKFNLEYFKKDNFRQLFDLPDSAPIRPGDDENVDALSQEALENVLAAAEDDIDDRNAALAAIKEVEAEKNEFCEESSNDKVSSDLQQIKNDFLTVLPLFTDVERYALHCLDPLFGNWTDEVVDKIMQSFVVEENDTSLKSSQEDMDSASVSSLSGSFCEDGDNCSELASRVSESGDSDDYDSDCDGPIVRNYKNMRYE